MRKIFIRADDFGISRSVNEAIISIAGKDLLKNVSILVNLPSSSYKAEELLQRDVSIGLHCNISIGVPCSKKMLESVLTRNGRFLSSGELRKMDQDLFDEKAIEAEILAQMEMFEKRYGKKPDYLDIHSVVNRKFIDVCKDIALGSGILYVTTPLSADGYYIKDKEMAWMISDGDISKELGIFPELLDQGEDISVAVFHPGFVDQELMDHSSLVQLRINDLEILNRKTIADHLKENRITSCRFYEL